MKTYINPDSFPFVNNPVVTMGTFDGVHLGHKSIFNKLIKIAREKQGETVVVTFDPHPRLVLQHNHENLKFLNTIEERKELIQNSGIDHLVILTFSKEFSKMSSDEFIKTILHDKIHAKNLVMGYDHQFGKDRRGDFAHLYRLGKELGFFVEQLPAIETDDVVVSSTIIRNALITGDVEKANLNLGYNYSISGKVIGGNRIGSKIGFPTANISIANEHKLIPANGVYAVYVNHKNRPFKGMLSIGSKPTFHDYSEHIEVHIFDFEENIYDQEIKISFSHWLREIEKFEDVEELKDQLFMDMERSKMLL